VGTDRRVIVLQMTECGDPTVVTDLKESAWVFTPPLTPPRQGEGILLLTRIMQANG